MKYLALTIVTLMYLLSLLSLGIKLLTAAIVLNMFIGGGIFLAIISFLILSLLIWAPIRLYKEYGGK